MGGSTRLGIFLRFISSRRIEMGIQSLFELPDFRVMAIGIREPALTVLYWMSVTSMEGGEGTDVETVSV